MKFKIHKNSKDIYFIRPKEEGKKYFKYIMHKDLSIANLLNIELKEYKNKIKDKFNIIQYKGGGIFFKTRDEAIKAKEWIEQQYILNRLRGEG
jgi:hypothetical protein